MRVSYLHVVAVAAQAQRCRKSSYPCADDNNLERLRMLVYERARQADLGWARRDVCAIRMAVRVRSGTVDAVGSTGPVCQLLEELHTFALRCFDLLASRNVVTPVNWALKKKMEETKKEILGRNR